MTTRLALPSLCAAAALLGSAAGRAQSLGDIALNQLEPPPAGDAFISVPSPFIGGHVAPRGAVLVDYADRPLNLAVGDTSPAFLSAVSISDLPRPVPVVGTQVFLHLNASFALWDRLLLSALLPVAVHQSGENPSADSITYASPSSAAVGDLRIGLRVRLLGADDDPFQAAAAMYLHIPTAASGLFTGDGAVRDSPHLILGGRTSGFVWSAYAGGVLRGSDHPSTITYGGAAALVLGDHRVQMGPEIFAATAIQEGFLRVTELTAIPRSVATNAEALLSARVRVVSGLFVSAGAGVGLTGAVGTPVYRITGGVAWAPVHKKAELDGVEAGRRDTDEDGIRDADDACPYAHGVASALPKHSGCPAADRDEDGIADIADACPTNLGVKSADAKKNGCPADTDDDGVPDNVDACPGEKGVANNDPTQNGCASARDTDKGGAAKDGNEPATVR